MASLPPDRPLRPLPSWTIPAGTLVVAVATSAAVWWLHAGVPATGDTLTRAQLRVEAIRAGLSIGAGVGAALALLLAFRRQQISERTQQAFEHDAAEKRVTELYVKAADQLGSDKAPVRLAGLYALERLAHDNPTHRQSIVEVICAYLRMPYTPHSPTSHDPDAPATDHRDERQVRLAAQRILARHLRPTNPAGEVHPAYWGPKIHLDLTEATLIDVNFNGCQLHNATFTKARFTGVALFGRTTFTGAARFDTAQFDDDVWFGEATFTSDAVFDLAAFTGDAWFRRATFTGSTFDEATFTGAAWFSRATFTDAARFDRTMFAGAAWFDKASFTNIAWFAEATFTGEVTFTDVTLNGEKYAGPRVDA